MDRKKMEKLARMTEGNSEDDAAFVADAFASIFDEMELMQMELESDLRHMKTLKSRHMEPEKMKALRQHMVRTVEEWCERFVAHSKGLPLPK